MLSFYLKNPHTKHKKVRVEYLGFAILLLIWASCKPLPEEVSNLNEGEIISIGHGGPGNQFFLTSVPHNTLAGFRKGLENEKLDGVEMDVQMTKDSSLILFHDEKLDGKTSLTGRVSEHSFEELTSQPYKIPFYSVKRKKTLIPGLQDALSLLKEIKPNGIYVLDLKIYSIADPGPWVIRFASELVRVIETTGSEKNVCIESMDPFLLSTIQKYNPNLKLFLYTTEMDKGIVEASENGFFGITIKHTLTSRDQIKKAHEKGLFVSIWGPRTGMANSRAIRMEPDYIQTDKIRNLTRKLERYQ